MQATLTAPAELVITAVDEERATATILSAFTADPAARWVYPDAAQYYRHFPEFIRAFAGGAFVHGSAYATSDYSGAALWLPPGAEPHDEALEEIFERTAPPEIRDDLFAMFEQMGSFHPSQPHWYLPMIGVDPPHQCKGYGSSLLAHALAICDLGGEYAYLESSNPQNIPLYRRHGFEIIGTIQAGSSPPIFPMLRKPRR